jgi:pilus assembly protein CpaB
MRAKSVILIVIALGCGLIASIGISQVMDRGSDETDQVETAAVLVANTDIDIGEAFNADNVRLEQWPQDRIPVHAVGSLEDLKDRFPRTRMYAGEVILSAKLMEGSLGSPSITIPEGYRVASVRVSMDSSVSGLVLPGDRVDIIAFLKQNGEVPRTVTRTILRDVRVFAVDSQTERELEDPSDPSTAAKTVSLLVKRDQVEPLMLALELGKLRLSLRRPNEVDERINANEATVESILGRPAERADEKPAQRGQFEDPAMDLVRFLSQPVPPQPAEATHEMIILSPQGMNRFRWDSNDAPPREVSWDDSTARSPAKGAIIPASPAGAGNAGADGNAGSAERGVDNASELDLGTEDSLGVLDTRP